MVHYNTNQQIVPPWSATGGTMQAFIVLDQPVNYSFTNLDEISGKVILRSTKSADVDDIVVKLEGESRTRLVNYPGPNGEKVRPKLEYHKILYRTQTVFPPSTLAEGRISSPVSGKPSYTLPPGTHEYPWKFKIPFNNSCHELGQGRSSILNAGITDWGIEIPSVPTQHIKKTLPPTLGGFPGEAEIRYFVKVTVSRHSFFKENPRAYRPFNFLPIEPPRPSPTGSQVFARQRHVFHASNPVDTTKTGKMKSMLGLAADAPPVAVNAGSADGLGVSADVRLPEPAILTCSKDIPLVILLKRLNSNSGQLHLQSLQIMLRSATRIRADDMTRTEQSSWIVVSKSNMGIPIMFTGSEEGAEAVLDDSMWRGQVLPNTIAPTFETCNITRWYSLDIRIGLALRGAASPGIQQIPQSIVLPLRLECSVFSGIAPPPVVLERMAQARGEKGMAPQYTPSDAMHGKLQTEAGPFQSHPTALGDARPPIPPRPSQAGVHTNDGIGDAPPSYEDAIAETVPPLRDARPDYAPPAVREDDLRRDEKRGWS